MEQFDYLIVGSGFAGTILAERLASQHDKKILVIEKRSHIAGNMYDYKDENGIFIHRYGPHLFRTNEDVVKDYLSNFTDWHPYQHKVLAHVDDKLVPVPFNLNSLSTLVKEPQAEIYKNKLIEAFGMDTKVPISILRKHPDKIIAELGNFIFEKIYLNYTTKQWGDTPENLDFDTITARIPVYISYDDRFFQQTFQALPKDGYTEMFAKMLAHPNITVLLNQDAHELIRLDSESSNIYFKEAPFHGTLIYTGQIDELFTYRLGELPYRSLQFDVKTFDMPIFQPTATVNYPNTEKYTRVTEYNYIMPVPNPHKTTVMHEYPQEFDRHDENKNIPYYPIPKDANSQLYNKYLQLAKKFKNLKLIGRLAEYRYYDMNDIIIRALEEFDDIEKI